ncbi:hypothetical protein P7D22_21495 [Lichenihabitans sp. Uapishka_5]|uniref:hypothetical protein n=1 Tax=Lichenihabitans sp. Uapishka_5 TaxID=3037302 RepID=UPI0029E8022E|nr:hypothetical protein [Lichenihabitans sp. Uapishka_5]MDX7953743.1 hypothetical protein [Lichenihabitans sp. Uapishka_5]
MRNDPSALTQAIDLVQSTARMRVADRVCLLFDHYRVASTGRQDAIVLALIAEVVAAQEMRSAEAGLARQEGSPS